MYDVSIYSLTKSKIPDLFRVWLTTAIKENGKQQNEVIASILRILLALPMTLDVLRASSLGKFVNRLKKHEETGKIICDLLLITLYKQRV
jgi:hypothetical protein